jgi:hypothetical protein
MEILKDKIIRKRATGSAAVNGVISDIKDIIRVSNY